MGKIVNVAVAVGVVVFLAGAFTYKTHFQELNIKKREVHALQVGKKHLNKTTIQSTTNQQSADFPFVEWRAFNHVPVWNGEMETYTPQNVIQIGQGFELISKGNYTSGAVISKRSFLYGKFVISAKLPSGKGLFPAMWFKPAAGHIFPEIDWMENIGSYPDIVHETLHYLVNGKEKTFTVKTTGPDYGATFHTYELDWRPNSITWKIDGKTVASTSQNIPQVPELMEIDTAIGGNWPGKPNSTTQFPQKFDVQYVKYYPLVNGNFVSK